MGAMSFTPNKDGTTTIKTNFNYFVSKRAKLYYEHYEGYEAANAAAVRFVNRPRNKDIVSSDITHDPWRRSVDVTIVERRS